MSMWASAGDAWDNSHDGQNMALVGGISDGLEHGDRGVNLYSHLLFSLFRRIYHDSANLSLGSQFGSAFGPRCRSRRGWHNVRKYPIPVLENGQEVTRLFSYTHLHIVLPLLPMP